SEAAVSRFASFDTALGRCGVAWTEAGILRLELSTSETRAETEPPPWVRELIVRVQRHLAGDVQDLSSARVDLTRVPAFHAKVYEALRLVPAGQTVTYGELAKRVGAPDAVRAVGQAMKKNPIPLVIPCHRVLAAKGAGGFTAPGGVATKERLLA